MRFILALILLLSSTSLHPSQKPVLHHFAKAKPGDFIVWEASKMITLIAVRSINPSSILLEEISAPVSVKPASWAEWVKTRAPGHTSWSMMEINLEHPEVIEAFSFTKSAWIATSTNDHFLTTLLHLSFAPLPDEKLRRIGPAPLDGERDQRKIWAPPFFIEGKQLYPPFDAFETTWPQDHSELSGKTLQLYFDRNALSPFPWWIHLETEHIHFTVRAIDSGHNLPSSCYRNLPKRAPEFLGAPVKTTSGGLQFAVRSPKYYRHFDLFAVDLSTSQKQMHLLTHHMQSSGERTHLTVEAEELAQMLEPHHAYTWLLMPTTPGSAYAELTKPFVFEP